MKKIDRLLISSFVPPFVVTFFIALFVLTMQILWVYIDDIIGKGAGLGIISEFIFYLSISQFIPALPIAILISSVMVLGNMAERYELSSIKSAGTSLLRIMRPLIFICIGIAIFSFITSNYLVPIANLKFKSRLFDIRQQKPALNLEEGIFNDDFKGYRIRIGNKSEDNQHIEDVFIANHITDQKEKLNELTAEKGLMYSTTNKRFLVMELENGQQFQEGNHRPSSQSRSTFVRTSFDKYTKIFDLSEFDMERTDEELFRNHYSMLSVRQLRVAIDSIDQQMNDRRETVHKHLQQYLEITPDSVFTSTPTESAKVSTVSKKSKKPSPQPRAVNPARVVIEQKINQPLSELESIYETFDKTRQQTLTDRALQQARSIKSNSESTQHFLVKTQEKKVKHIFELYSKMAYATVCLVFLFIGAPMGALVRKGGFGYPLLISIIFFIAFITLTLTFKRMAEAAVMHPTLAAWMPNLIILPIGLLLTWKAMNDSRFMESNWFTKLFDFLKKYIFPAPQSR